jgi:hypothetical protein
MTTISVRLARLSNTLHTFAHTRPEGEEALLL